MKKIHLQVPWKMYVGMSHSYHTLKHIHHQLHKEALLQKTTPQKPMETYPTINEGYRLVSNLYCFPHYHNRPFNLPL